MKCNFPAEAAVLAEYTEYGRLMKPFLTISQTFGQIDRMNFGVFGVFSADLSAPILFSINQPLFLQKTKPLYPNPKYLFGIGI